MAEKISSRLVGMLNTQDEQNLRILLGALQDDITAIRDSLIVLAAKLDDDASVTDTDYEALCTPAAQTFIK